MPAPSSGLTPAELEHYRKAGHVTVRGSFAPEEIHEWRQECERLWALADAQLDAARIQHRGRVTGGSIADRIDPVVDVSPLFAALARDARILGPVGAALGSGAILFKDKLISKLPGTLGYGLHQDFPYWEWLGIPAAELLSVQVAIDAATEDNGALEVFEGLHHAKVRPAPDNPLDADEAAVDPSRCKRADLAAGDLLLFHSLVPHKSGPNTSAVSRRALFLTYCAARHADAYQRNRARPRLG